MKLLSATTRLTFGLICLSFSIWLVAFALGLLPDRNQAIVKGRAALLENVAHHCSLMASRNDHQTMETSLRFLVERNKEIISAAIRRPDNSFLVAAGDHQSHWSLPPGKRSTETNMRLPILAGSDVWGFVEMRFLPLTGPETGWAASWWNHPVAPLGAFIASLSGLLFSCYLQKMLRHLDPTKVIPSRVRATLDTLAEGLLVVDKQERILLANRSFANSLGVSPQELTGRKASELPWETQDKLGANQVIIEGYPWKRAIESGLPQRDELLTIRDKDHQTRVLKVSAAPVYADDETHRGAMASFDDVTQIEKNRTELRQMLDALSQSRDEIHRQNLELERLAAHDPLTSCLNRRAMLSHFEKHWNAPLAAQRARTSHNGRNNPNRGGAPKPPLACIMVDLDHFKSINDAHGHQRGDLVLEKTGSLLRNSRRATDLVCRYGGEEFCIILPNTDLDAAQRVAEQIRSEVEGQQFENLTVTASIGVSAQHWDGSLGARSPQELIDQADKCLYVAKRQGRNCVIRFDHASEQIAQFEAQNKVGAQHKSSGSPSSTNSRTTLSKPEGAQNGAGEYDPNWEGGPVIPFHAVTALVSALAYRDPSTADHSRRVADLCVRMADRLSLQRESIILETAALLHDIGKIGVPDAILLKPGRLTEEEWEVMNNHERIGLEIIETTFSCSHLTEVIRNYRGWPNTFLANSQKGVNPEHPQLPTQLRAQSESGPKGPKTALGEISLLARILAIADAYDAMTHRQAYRESLTSKQAFEELRRCAGRQFDPQLVERFIELVADQQAGERAGVREGTLPKNLFASKDAVLSFGVQIERLADAVDKEDRGGLVALSRRLRMTAMKYEVDEIAAVAEQLENAAQCPKRGGADIKQLVQLTAELLELCRSAQRSYLEGASAKSKQPPVENSRSRSRPHIATSPSVVS